MLVNRAPEQLVLAVEHAQWQAADLVALEPEPKPKYPKNAPTATANIIQPL